MARAKDYRLGIDDLGVVRLQATFETGAGLRFKWRTGFILHKDPVTQNPRWGIWDSQRVLWDTDDAKAAIQAIDALLENGYYLADTILPEIIEGYTDKSAIILLPPIHQDRVELTAKDRKILGSQRDILDLYQLADRIRCDECGGGWSDGDRPHDHSEDTPGSFPPPRGDY